MQISTIKSTVLKSGAKKTVQTNMLIHSHQRITLTLTPIMNSPIDIKCLSLNVRGLNKSVKRRTVFRWLHRQNCSFVFLQETYSSKECENIWQAEWGGEVFFSHGTNHINSWQVNANILKVMRNAFVRDFYFSL